MTKLIGLQIEIFLLSLKHFHSFLFFHFNFIKSFHFIVQFLYLNRNFCLNEHFLFLNSRKMYIDEAQFFIHQK